MDNLVYEDKYPWFLYHSYPWYKRYWLGQLYQLRMWPILPVLLVIFIAGVIIASTRIEQEAVFFSIIGATLFLMFAITMALFPSKYQIFDDRIRIVLGFVFHFDIPFSNIENATAATWRDTFGLKLNFVVRYSSNDILQIIRKHGDKIYISPSNRTLFLEHLNKAVYDWKRGASRVGS